MKIDELSLTYNEADLIPCVVQSAQTKAVLMMAWMNEESIRLTFETGTTWFWSRSRNELWNKGATSGNMQHLVSLSVDCDQDCLLAVVNEDGPACHTGEYTCFYREVEA